MLTGAGRGLSLTQRTARKLPTEPDVLELDVTDADHVDAVRDDAGASKWGRVDGALHAIGFAPASCLGGGFLEAPWDDVAVALQHLDLLAKALAEVVAPLMTEGGSIVGLDFDASRGVAGLRLDGRGQGRRSSRPPATWPATSAPQGIRVNLVAAGPIKTMAAKSIPGFAQFEDVWDDRAPLGWDVARRRGRRPGLRRAAVRLVPGDHRRDDPRRRRLPRHRRLTRPFERSPSVAGATSSGGSRYLRVGDARACRHGRRDRGLTSS